MHSLANHAATLIRAVCPQEGIGVVITQAQAVTDVAGVFAALVNLPIREQPLLRPAAA